MVTDNKKIERWYEFENVNVKVLKFDSYLPKKLFHLLQWKPFQNHRKYIWFFRKTLFVLKIFKFLSWLFGHVEKTTRLEILG